MSQVGMKKSRAGCKRCKTRRVKCDERAPCSNCVRRNEACSLLEPTPSGSSDTQTDPGLPSTQQEWFEDLELMHHYSTSTASGQFGFRERIIALWRDYIPRQALKHSFLMHGILALAALHLAYLHPEDQARYVRLCDKHQAMALEMFRTVLASSTSEHADALFALAGLISVSSMARPCVVNVAATLDVDAIADMMLLTQGVREVIYVQYEHIRSGPMSELFEQQQVPKGTEVILPSSVVDRLTTIRGMLDSYGRDSETSTHCQAALAELENIFKDIMYVGPTADIEMALAFRWQVMVPPEYVKLVQARVPPALIVLAYYVAGATAVRPAWYSENFCEYALRGISKELDSSMQHWLDWPWLQLHERMRVLDVHSSLTKTN